MCKCVDIRGHHLGRIASTERTVASEVEGEFPLPLCCYQRDDDFFIWGLRVRHRQGMMLLERKNRALQRTNRLVEEARDEAERLSKKKTVYTQNLAHEIRTPLNQMYGFVQLLADESMPLDDEQRREVIQGIHEGCEQLTRVVLEIDTVAAKLDEMDSLMKVESVLK